VDQDGDHGRDQEAVAEDAEAGTRAVVEPQSAMTPSTTATCRSPSRRRRAARALAIRVIFGRVVRVVNVGLLVLIAALLALAAVVAATAFAVTRTIELIRRFRMLTATVGRAMAEVAEAGERVAERAATVGERTAALEPALERLAVSRSRLGVLLAAWSDVRVVAAGVTGLRPRK
jgi:hypothetical protein